jgi:hypothetical protein
MKKDFFSKTIEDYKGCILTNAIHKSDWEMGMDWDVCEVWDDETKNIWTKYCSPETTKDATIETLRKVEKFYRAKYLKQYKEEAEFELNQPRKGKKIEVTQGRKYKGQTGIVEYRGEVRDMFSRSGRVDKVLFINDNGEKCWVPTYYCKVLDPGKVDMKAIKERVGRLINSIYTLQSLRLAKV